VFVETNEYEDGRGHVIVYNWDQASSVVASLANVLTVGASYEIHHVYDLNGTPVVSGVYDGGGVRIPMRPTAAPRPLGGQQGLNDPIVLSPEFGAFVVTTVATSSANLVAADGAAPSAVSEDVLTPQVLEPIVEFAIGEWAKAGLSDAEIEVLKNAEFCVVQLPGPLLGQAAGNTIALDADAAGYGWFVDPTPSRDEEFTSRPGMGSTSEADSPAANHMDLLTAVMHELGHLLGNDHESASDFMAESLESGVRPNLEPKMLDALMSDASFGGELFN
jgi:hypothetical protein